MNLESLAFAGFLCAGNLKADPRISWLPFDLTFVFACFSMILGANRFLRNGLRIPRAVFLMVGLFFFFGYAVFWTKWSPYATEKTIRLFTLTLLAGTLPLFLFDTIEGVSKLFNAVVLIAAVMLVDAGSSFLSNPEFKRLTATGADPIGLGRMTGIAVLWLFMGGYQSTWPRFLAASIALVPFTLVLIASGSRGPLIGLVLSIVVVLLFFDLGRTMQAGRLLMIAAIAFLSFFVGLQFGPGESVQRIEDLTGGGSAVSSEARMILFSTSIEGIARSPLGHGWGGFERTAVHIPYTTNNVYRYPHNFILEALFEGGWLVGVILTFVVCWANIHSAKLALHCRCIETKGLFAMLFYCTINALVSGDLNDNRFMFALTALSLGLSVRSPLSTNRMLKNS